MDGTTHDPTVREGSCRGIIFRLYPYSDTSLIFHVLSRELGLISLIAKGARRLNSSFAGKLDLFYLCRFEFIPSRKSDLHTLRRCSRGCSPEFDSELSTPLRRDAAGLERLVEREYLSRALRPLQRLFEISAAPCRAPAGNILFRIRLLALWAMRPN